MNTDNQILESELIQSIVDNLGHGKTRYAFLLGAGASVSSGIPLAKDLAERWFNELKTSNPDAYQPIDVKLKKKQSFSNLYSEIYSKRFEKFPNDGYSTIAEIITDAKVQPSLGYTFLADILRQTRNNIVLTTNFDRLTETELLTTFGHNAKVTFHESLLKFLQLNDEDPTILKIHNDVLFDPDSDPSIESLSDKWQITIQSILQTYNLIVLGYGGNDKEGLAQFLESQDEDTSRRIYWCSINEKYPPNENFHHVKIESFDKFFATLHQAIPKDFKISFPAIEQLIDDKAISKKRQLNEGLKKITGTYSTIKEQKGNRERKEVKDGEKQKTSHSLDDFIANTWWEYQIKIDQTESIDEKEALYKEGLEKFDKSAELMGNYANFLFRTKRNYNQAEKYYLKALEIDPNNATNNRNYATFLWENIKDYDKAEEYYLKALEIEPNNASNNGNYAIFLKEYIKDYEKAEKHFLKALEIEPNNAHANGNYATFLWEYVKDYDQAEKYYLKALEIDPNNAMNNRNYATFLWQYIKDYDKAEKHYLLALEIDPNNATNNGNYAAFLTSHHKDYKQAEIYYKKALEIEPNNAANNGNYANFLFENIKDYDKAEIYYLKALKIDPDHVNNNCNYAVFLQIHRKDYNQAEKYYLKALEIEPNDATYNGNYAGFLLATSRKKEAIPYLEIAEKTSYQDELKLELLFYRLAHFPEDYAKSKSAISELLQKGVRSIGWNFDAHIERAEKDGCTYVDELREIAKAITTEYQQ